MRAVAVAYMAPEHEEAKQLSGAHSAALGRKTAGRQLSVLAAASCCPKTRLAHRGSEARSQYAVGVDDELRRLPVALARSRLVAVYTDSGVPVQAAHKREQNSVVRETHNATVRSLQVEVMGVAGHCLWKSQVEIYYGHPTSKDVSVPRWFVHYGLHGPRTPSLLSCYRMLERHYLAESFLAC